MNEAQRRDQFLSLVRNRMNPALRGADYDRCFNSVRAERPDLLDNRAAPTLAIANSFDPSQPRDEYGKWVDEGGLTGSEKQVAWAKEIRKKAVADYLSGKERNQKYLDTRADTEEAGWREGLNDPDEGMKTAAKEALEGQEERWLAETHRDALKHLKEAEGGRASFWIDRRGMSFGRPGEAESTIRRLAMKPDPATGRFRRMIRKKTLVDQAGQPVPKLFGD